MAEAAIPILSCDLITPLGHGLEANWEGLLRGIRPFAPFARCELPTGPEPRAVRLLTELELEADEPPVLYVGTTVGAIERVESAVRAGTPPPDPLDVLLTCARRHFGATRAELVSAACSSGQAALAAAVRAIRSGEATRALAVGCDAVSEFAVSGFTTLGAVSATGCRPYAVDRDGLTPGEAAAALLLGSPESVSERGLPVAGWVLGCGASCDAEHATAPRADGEPLVRAIRQALGEAGIGPAAVSAVLGHGTGTVHNDAAELAALEKLFPPELPLLSIKGQCGHPLGASGLVQTALALAVLQHRKLPPQAGCRHPETTAQKRVGATVRELGPGVVLSLNLGFGGLNSAVVIGGAT